MIYVAILDKKVEGNVAYIYELSASGDSAVGQRKLKVTQFA